MVTSIEVLRYTCIFHLKNAVLANEEYWYLFINLWIFSAVIITNSVNWFLPGFYSLTYEMCTCSSQDYNQQSKFEKTALISTLLTVIVYVIVSVKIKLYKYKTQPLDHPAANKNMSKNKLIADLTLTIFPTFLIIVTFLVNLLVDRTRSGIPYSQFPYYLIIQVQYLIVFPLVCTVFVAIFYATNKVSISSTINACIFCTNVFFLVIFWLWTNFRMKNFAFNLDEIDCSMLKRRS